MITSSTQIRYFLRDNGSSAGNLAQLEVLLRAHKYDFDEPQFNTDAADCTDPQYGDEVGLTIYCETVAQVRHLCALLEVFEAAVAGNQALDDLIKSAK